MPVSPRCLFYSSCVDEVTEAPISLGVDFYDNSILAQLFLNQNHFLHALDDEVSPDLATLSQPRQVASLFPVSTHLELRNMSGIRPITTPVDPFDCLVTISFPRVYSTSTVIEPHVISRSFHTAGAILHHVILLHARFPDVNVRVFEIEIWIAIARHPLVRLRVYDFLNLIHQVVDRVDEAVFDQPSDFEKNAYKSSNLSSSVRDRRRHLRGITRETLHRRRERASRRFLGASLLLMVAQIAATTASGESTTTSSPRARIERRSPRTNVEALVDARAVVWPFRAFQHSAARHRDARGGGGGHNRGFGGGTRDWCQDSKEGCSRPMCTFSRGNDEANART